jgi:hypothetical protein
MTTMKHMRILTTWITCLTCFLSGLGGAAGAVLCIGADGHIGLETVGGGCCDHPGAEEDVLGAEPDHRPDCLDICIPYSPHQKVTSPGKNDNELTESFAEAIISADYTSDGIAQRVVPQFPPEKESRLLSLRTVIFLN